MNKNADFIILEIGFGLSFLDVAFIFHLLLPCEHAMTLSQFLLCTKVNDNRDAMYDNHGSVFKKLGWDLVLNVCNKK